MALKKDKKCAKGTPGWMVSWSDMTTLLLTFFIVMIGASDIVERDFYLILSSFKGTLGVMGGGQTISQGKLEDLGHTVMSLPSATKGSSLAKSLKLAVSMFKPELESKTVRISEDERGLVITLSGDAYFDPGSAVIKDEIRPVLKKTAAIIKNIDNFVRIEGHTDNTPVALASTQKGFPTNWELSSARSVNVLRHLNEEEGTESKRLSAVAFGETRPIDINAQPEGRAYNRRVDIVILRDKSMVPSKIKDIEKPLPDEEWR